MESEDRKSTSNFSDFSMTRAAMVSKWIKLSICDPILQSKNTKLIAEPRLTKALADEKQNLFNDMDSFQKKMLQNDYLKSFCHLHFIPEENVQLIIMNWDRESGIA